MNLKSIKLVIICVMSFLSFSTYSNEGFDGGWEAEEINRRGLSGDSFTLSLDEVKGKLVGRYCYVISNGEKDYCSQYDNLKGSIEGNRAEVYFYSISGKRTEAKALLEFSDNTLGWRLLIEPEGNLKAPETALLKPLIEKGIDGDVYILKTKDFYINIKTHCGFNVVNCDKVSYRGQRKKDNAVIMLTGASYIMDSGDVIYEFENKNFIYRISKKENSLKVFERNKVVLHQKGKWMQ